MYDAPLSLRRHRSHWFQCRFWNPSIEASPPIASQKSQNAAVLNLPDTGKLLAEPCRQALRPPMAPSRSCASLAQTPPSLQRPPHQVCSLARSVAPRPIDHRGPLVAAGGEAPSHWTNSGFSTLPIALRGNSFTTTTWRGIL